MATATADKKGMKRICPSCSTRYYDFNKRPVLCPNCKTEFTAEMKAKVRRRPAANDIEDSQVTEETAAKKVKGGDDEDEDAIEAEEGVVSLEDAEVVEADSDDDEAVELDEDDPDLDDEDDDFDDDEDDEEEDVVAEDDAETPKPKKKR